MSTSPQRSSVPWLLLLLSLAHCTRAGIASLSRVRAARGNGMPQLELPGLADEIVSEAAMGFPRRSRESRLLVQVAGRREVFLRPQDDSLIAGRAREAHALPHERPTQPEAARLGLHQQQAQFRAAARASNQENAPEAPAGRIFRNPAALACPVELANEFGGDPGHQSFELLVPTVLAEVQQAVTLDHPAHVAGAVRRRPSRCVPARPSLQSP